MIFAYAIIIQLGFFFFLIISGSNSFVYLAKFFRFLSTLVAIHIITKREKDAYKLTWVFLVLLFPIFGGLMYIMFYRQTSRKKVRKRIEELQKRSAPASHSSRIPPCRGCFSSGCGAHSDSLLP